MIHTGDTYAPTGKVKFAHPLHVDEVAVDFPRVKFLICHLGNPWFRDCMEVVYKNDNVYTDISGLTLGQFTDRFEAYMRQQLKEMILWGVNPNKVLYGTDWPLASMESYLAFMEELKLPPRDKDMMFFENAAALFKLDAATPANRAGLVPQPALRRGVRPRCRRRRCGSGWNTGPCGGPPSAGPCPCAVAAAAAPGRARRRSRSRCSPRIPRRCRRG